MTSDTIGIDLPGMRTVTPTSPLICRASAFDEATAPRDVLLRFLDRALAASFESGRRVGVMIIELDGMGDPDSSAPGTGGDLLTQVAERGRRIVRSDDLFCHLGANVCAIVWLRADEVAQAAVAARLVMELKAPFQVGAGEIFLDVVFGNSISDPLSTALTLVAKAERSVVVMKAARRHGLFVPSIGSEQSPRSSRAGGHVRRGDGSPAMFVVDLADGRLRHADERTERLFGEPAARLVGRHIANLIDATATGGTYLAFAALATGAIHTFRSRCTMRSDGQSFEASVAVRTMHLRGGSVAVWTVLPDGDRPCANEAGGVPFWRGGVELVCGSIGPELRVASVEVSDGCVEANDVALRAHDSATALQRSGASLVSSVHPDDAAAVRHAHAEAASGRHATTTAVRWFHPEGGWFNAHLTLFATGSADPAESAAFVLTEAQRQRAAEQPDERVVRLERILAHIAAEAHGADNVDVLSSSEHIDWSRLDHMSARQREVVKRLVRGERVPSIANAMFISRSTVRNHLSGAFRLCGVNSQSDLVQLFLSPGSRQSVV